MEKEYLEVNFINDDELVKDKYLWKYLDLHKFLYFLFKKSLYLTRLDKFEDRREGISSNQLLLKHFKRRVDNHPTFDTIRQFMEVDTLGLEMNQNEDKLRIIQRFNFASCWVVGENLSESAAMWNLYSNPNSVAIKIKYSDFKENFLLEKIESGVFQKEIICSPVKYLDFQSERKLSEQDGNLTDTTFIKDSSFGHEKEFRIVMKENERQIKSIEHNAGISRKHIENLYNFTYDYAGIPIPLNNFENYNFEIIHHPKSDQWAKHNIGQILNKFEINFKVSDSNLELK
ncbi:MAG: hypothetical protein KBB37_03970 [Bacteroidia bacterium]|nr:hypothetical protein [Bacteroidia bacterium]MBP7260423.1 hypothetical protein [Bacteroidia bacterium]MBP9179759.1 hypothetical protein [Bacteroidia bacterium]MBP9724116.1 hypothetical protein [Bacteroidia bacterium]